MTTFESIVALAQRGWFHRGCIRMTELESTRWLRPERAVVVAQHRDHRLIYPMISETRQVQAASDGRQPKAAGRRTESYGRMKG